MTDTYPLPITPNARPGNPDTLSGSRTRHRCGQRFQAAGSYWLMRPPLIGRRRILP
jgi:hypothetical protein